MTLINVFQWNIQTVYMYNLQIIGLFHNNSTKGHQVLKLFTSGRCTNYKVLKISASKLWKDKVTDITGNAIEFLMKS